MQTWRRVNESLDIVWQRINSYKVISHEMLNLRLGNKPQEECSTRAVGSSTGATSFCCSLNSRLGEKSRNLMATLPDGNGNINSSMMITAVSERDAWFIFSTLNKKKKSASLNWENRYFKYRFKWAKRYLTFSLVTQLIIVMIIPLFGWVLHFPVRLSVTEILIWMDFLENYRCSTKIH